MRPEQPSPPGPPEPAGQPEGSWTLEIGGLRLEALQEALGEAGIALNPLAEELLAWQGLGLGDPSQPVQLRATTVAALGHPQGATMPEILRAAKEQRLTPCAPCVGPFLRLAYRDQPEAQAEPKAHAPLDIGKQPGRAPAGSLTIATEDLGLPVTAPRGFYLRNIQGTLWLRGYRADDLHVWSPEDTFVLCQDPADLRGRTTAP